MPFWFKFEHFPTLGQYWRTTFERGLNRGKVFFCSRRVKKTDDTDYWHLWENWPRVTSKQLDFILCFLSFPPLLAFLFDAPPANVNHFFHRVLSGFGIIPPIRPLLLWPAFLVHFTPCAKEAMSSWRAPEQGTPDRNCPRRSIEAKMFVVELGRIHPIKCVQCCLCSIFSRTKPQSTEWSASYPELVSTIKVSWATDQNVAIKASRTTDSKLDEYVKKNVQTHWLPSLAYLQSSLSISKCGLKLRTMRCEGSGAVMTHWQFWCGGYSRGYPGEVMYPASLASKIPLHSLAAKRRHRCTSEKQIANNVTVDLVDIIYESNSSVSFA